MEEFKFEIKLRIKSRKEKGYQKNLLRLKNNRKITL